MRPLLAVLCLLLWILPAPARERPSNPYFNPVRAPAERPHMFWEPQVRYPPEGADEALRHALPRALFLALLTFALANLLTRPSSPLAGEVGPVGAAEASGEGKPVGAEMPIEVGESRPVAVSAEPPAAKADPVGRPQPCGEALRQVAPRETGAAPAPPLQGETGPAGRDGFPAPSGGVGLRSFSWEAALGLATISLPFVPGATVEAGLVGYLAEEPLRRLLGPAITGYLLRESRSAVVLLAGSFSDEEVGEGLLAGEAGAPARTLEGRPLSRALRRAQAFSRRLFVPADTRLAPQALCRRLAALADEFGSAVVVADLEARGLVGASDAETWMGRLHEVCRRAGVAALVVGEPGRCPREDLFLRTYELRSEGLGTVRLAERRPGSGRSWSLIYHAPTGDLRPAG